MNGELLVERLLAYAKKNLHLDERDAIYMRNVLLAEFRLSAAYEGEVNVADIQAMDVPDQLNSEITEFALKNHLTEEGEAERYCAKIWGMLSPLPSKINDEFYRLKEECGGQTACDYLYNISVKNGYIQKTAISRNLKWEYPDGKNLLEITVNLSKPEKNNKDIAKLLTQPQSKKYPMCALCKENEGFEGAGNHPPRQNIRTVKMTLGGEKWFMQYSPYAYYDEHCIAISEKHTPMRSDATTVAKLLDFVDILPNYSIGSNAALPIVGGSILNHEHFQGGRHLMPMHRAGIRKELHSDEYPQLKIGILDWYNSGIRIEGEDRKAVLEFAAKVIETWKKFSCPECEILSETDGVPHNASSPICIKSGKKYIFTVLLRNNRTNEQYPDGIFHVHPEHLNIKSEGIGLIEAMGLFILPGRLKRQLDEIENILCGKTAYDAKSISEKENDLYVHRFMIEKLMSEGMSDTKEAAHKRVENFVGKTCAAILDNTAVFKQTEAGEKGFLLFAKQLNLSEV